MRDSVGECRGQSRTFEAVGVPVLQQGVQPRVHRVGAVGVHELATPPHEGFRHRGRGRQRRIHADGRHVGPVRDGKSKYLESG